MKHTKFFALILMTFASLTGRADDNNDIYCTIKENGSSLACQWVGREHKAMNSDEIAQFIDLAATGTYMTVRSKKGFERTFLTDPAAPQFKRLNDTKRNGSMSDVGRVKSEIFMELERKVIKISDDLDHQAAGAEFVKFDPSVGTDKMKREGRPIMAELEGYRKNKDKACTSTPAFEQLSRANAKLQSTLSNIVVAFQTPGTCMSEFKIFKDRDGSVDLRQLDTVPSKYAESCKKK